ncbi:CHASE4 domain-containing protein [Gracilinema caldarium]|uniref:CHASE4 domain-containing protein n=1 Tax=Gracilinema caldarium TaxID=215591 RepID=UPI0026EFB76F|nr:CHASE4 domain-containing protein [Gracilinema caldarium]
MSQRNKVLLLFGITVFLFFCTTLTISWIFFTKSITTTEQSQLAAIGERLTNLIADDLEQLDRLTTDWAYWDETWTYLAGTNKEFEASNFSVQALQNLGLAALYCFTIKGTIQYRYTIDGKPAETLEKLGNIEPAELLQEGRKGIVRDGTRYFLAAGRAILHNDGYGRPMGSLWMFWPLNERRLSRYSRLLGLSVRLNKPSETGQDHSFAYHQNKILMNLTLSNMEKTELISFTLEQERRMHQYSTAMFSLFMWTMLIVMLLLTLSLYLLIRKQIFKPLQELTAALAARREQPDKPLIIKGIKHDEIDELIQAFNSVTEQLDAKLKERENLLHEIYHRVYNNLQIMASILQLQAYRSQNEDAVNAALQSRRRILAMAHIQRLLYEQEDITRINLADCLNAIIAGFEPEEAPAIPIRLETDLSTLEERPFYLSLERTIPLALVMSELLSNSYAHAFAGRQNGSILIQIEIAENQGEIIIFVIDDGIGIPEYEKRQEGLGFELIKILTDQIGGTFSIERIESGGTQARIHVPIGI